MEIRIFDSKIELYRLSEENECTATMEILLNREYFVEALVSSGVRVQKLFVAQFKGTLVKATADHCPELPRDRISRRLPIKWGKLGWWSQKKTYWSSGAH